MQPNPPSLNVMRILWGAMTMSLLFFFFVLLVQNPFNLEKVLQDINSNPTNLILLLVASINYVVAWLLPKFFIKNSTKLGAVPATDEALAKFCFVPLLLRLAIGEAVTLFGFILAMQMQNAAVIVPFLMASLSITFLNFPTMKLFRTWVGR